MKKTVLSAIAVALIALPASAQTVHDVADLGFRFSAPETHEVERDGILVTAYFEELDETIEFRPFSVTRRERARTERVQTWFELLDYDFLGAEEVRGGGSVVVTGEGTDGQSLVVLREVWVDGDGGLRIIAYMDPVETEAALAIVNSVEVTDPSAIMRAGRQAGQID